MSADSVPPTTEREEIEGIEATDGTWGEYPIDTFLIRTDTRTVYDVIRRIEKGSYVMDPEFQRDFIWDEVKQSKLIESVLMRIPLPVFYLAEDDQGRMVVVDGLQRLSTFRRFLNNELRLRLPTQTQLHNKRFEDLSPKLQNRVEDCNIINYIVDAKVPERARLDIFERVNGGVPLTRQQMRNCLFMGAATKFLRVEAQSALFVKATGGSLNTKLMRDREFVNRFCAFHLLSLNDYRGDMDEFLASALRHMNRLSLSEMQTLSAKFRRSLSNNRKVFGDHAFRKRVPDTERRSVLNASLWDVMSTGLCEVPEQVAEARASDFRAAFSDFMSDELFMRAITYSVNDVRMVRARFSRAQEMFKEVLDD